MPTASQSRQSAARATPPKKPVRPALDTTPTKNSDSITVASVIHVIPDSSSDDDGSGRYSPSRSRAGALAEMPQSRPRKRVAEHRTRTASGAGKSSDQPSSPKRRKTRDVASRTPTPSDSGRPSSRASASNFTPYASLHLTAETQQLKGQNLELKKKLDQAEEERKKLGSENSSVTERLSQAERLIALLTRTKEACKEDERNVHGIQLQPVQPAQLGGAWDTTRLFGQKQPVKEDPGALSHNELEVQRRKAAKLEAMLARTAPQLEAMSTSLRSFWQQHIGEVVEGDSCLDMLTKLQHLYVPLHQEVTRLEEINQGLEAQYRERDSELPATLSRIAWLEGREKDLTDGNTTLEAKVVELHSSLQQEAIRKATLEEEKRVLALECKHIGEDLKNLKEKSEGIEGQLHRVSSMWRSRELAFSTIVEGKDADLALSRNEASAAKEEASRARARVDVLEGELTLLTRQVSELSTAQKRVKDLEAQERLLRQALAKHQEQEASVREQATSMHATALEYISDLEKQYQDGLRKIQAEMTARLAARAEQSKEETALFKGYLAKRDSA